MLLLVCLIVVGCVSLTKSSPSVSSGKSSSPNLIFILLDDAGWADFGYNVPHPDIPTPNINQLAQKGIRLSSHYVHPTCTPSRAALMTGRYSTNTGLIFASFPGSVGGLPPSMATLPQLLREEGYSAHMVGKWHLGHAKPSMTPVGRGFQSHTGSYLWALDSRTKLMWDRPWRVLTRDWVTTKLNGSSHHFSEPRHATIATTENAVNLMKNHKNYGAAGAENPLFLYISYNAPHNPLQPEPGWEAACSQIPHLWRRQFCGMMVGLDQAIARVVEEARGILGEDTVVVVTSDNGGANWFGGLNQPLRAGKLTPFEGGVRVPAFALDISGGNYLGPGGREVTGLFHICDWLPTFLRLANSVPKPVLEDLDGVNQLEVLRGEKEQVREKLLLDLYTSQDSHDGKSLAAFRFGRYKLMEGVVRDSSWYTKSTQDHVNSTRTGFIHTISEQVCRFSEWVLGSAKGHLIKQILLNIFIMNTQVDEQIFLFDILKDPEERHNLVEEYPKVVEDIREEIRRIEGKRPRSDKYWMVSRNFSEGFVIGDCEEDEEDIPCWFTAPWLPDSSDIDNVAELDLVDQAEGVRNLINQGILYFYGGILILVCSIIYCIFNRNKVKIKIN